LSTISCFYYIRGPRRHLRTSHFGPFDSPARHLLTYAPINKCGESPTVKRLTVPLASISADGVIIDVVVPIAEVQPPDAEGGVPARAVNVAGALSEAGDEYVFRGTLFGVFEHACDRCLDVVSLPFDIDVLWDFKEGPAPVIGDGVEETDRDAETPTALTFEGNEIDLAPCVWEEVLLAMPLKFVCREGCAGLCPHCGANLNRERCTCREKDKMDNKGLAGLADIFPDLRPKHSEE